MEYEKPEIVRMAAASVAVQGGLKGLSTVLDIWMQYSIGAYEADE